MVVFHSSSTFEIQNRVIGKKHITAELFFSAFFILNQIACISANTRKEERPLHSGFDVQPEFDMEVDEAREQRPYAWRFL